MVHQRLQLYIGMASQSRWRWSSRQLVYRTASNEGGVTHNQLCLELLRRKVIYMFTHSKMHLYIPCVRRDIGMTSRTTHCSDLRLITNPMYTVENV